MGRGGWRRALWQHAARLDQHQVTVSLALLCLFTMNFFAGTDPDFWWHLRTGQLIAETGAVPHADVYSYTAVGQPWVAHEWLAELIMYWLYSWGGYVTEVAVFSLVITAAYFVLYRLLRRLGIDKTLTLAIVVWTVVVRLAIYAPRPQLFTFLLFAIFLYILFDYKVGGRVSGAGRLWLLPPLMVPWVNLHAGYVIGLFLIGLFFVGELLNHLIRRPAADVRPLLFVGLASAAAVLINPNNYKALLYPFTYAGSSNASMRFITEWQSPDFHQYIFLTFALTIVVLMIVGPSDRFDFTTSLLVAAFTVMALQSARHIVLFALAAAPVLALRLKARNVRLSREIAIGSSITPLLNVLMLVVVPAVLAAIVVASPISQVRLTPGTSDYPAGGVAYLKAYRPAGNLFNTYGWGGYLIYALYPDYRVFIDGRADMYGDALMEEYAQVANIRPGWREVLDRHQVTIALVEKDSPVSVLLQSQADWQAVYEGEVEKIFVRK